jgi:hypothetical protein
MKRAEKSVSPSVEESAQQEEPNVTCPKCESQDVFFHCLESAWYSYHFEAANADCPECKSPAGESNQIACEHCKGIGTVLALRIEGMTSKYLCEEVLVDRRQEFFCNDCWHAWRPPTLQVEWI